jgi:hypothetical protein
MRSKACCVTRDRRGRPVLDRRDARASRSASRRRIAGSIRAPMPDRYIIFRLKGPQPLRGPHANDDHPAISPREISAGMLNVLWLICVSSSVDCRHGRQRYQDPDRRPASCRAVDGDLPAIRLDEAFRRWQTQAGAARFRREERHEDLVSDVTGIPGPASVNAT